jgi:hypothetical protein
MKKTLNKITNEYLSILNKNEIKKLKKLFENEKWISININENIFFIKNNNFNLIKEDNISLVNFINKKD